MEGNNSLDHVIRRVSMENSLNFFPDFPSFPMQESHHTLQPSTVPTAGNSPLNPEIDPLFPMELWPQISRALKERVRAVLDQENRHPPSPTSGPSARNHPLQQDVFYPDDIRHQNLAPTGNSAIYSHLHRQVSRDPLCPGGESFWDSRLTDYGSRLNPSFPDELPLEAKFARLNFSEDLERPLLSELLSVYGGAAPERRNSSSLNWLRGNEQPPQFSYGDLQALRARAAADGFTLPQAYPTFKDPFLNPDSYWVNRDSNGFNNIFGDTNAYNRGMNISGGYDPLNGFDFSKHISLSMNGVNSNNSVSSIPSASRNRYIHGSEQMVTYSSIEDLKGRVFSEPISQYGCRLLRQKLDERKPEDIQMIFSEVKDHVHTLMSDRFGNSVIQKLFEVCDQDQMSQLVSLFTADRDLLSAVCLEPQGYQSMQKFVECLMAPEQISGMISIFRQITVRLVNNPIGSRVIRHCLEIFPVEETEVFVAQLHPIFL
ncbi:uncharacterized protein [Primulina eburnea]|uniref:uncharacterized protein n=1 Tax=Primulina eburnea TaxID=1245227 RepID=UPI003C6BE1BA